MPQILKLQPLLYERKNVMAGQQGRPEKGSEATSLEYISVHGVVQPSLPTCHGLGMESIFQIRQSDSSRAGLVCHAPPARSP